MRKNIFNEKKDAMKLEVVKMCGWILEKLPGKPMQECYQSILYVISKASLKYLKTIIAFTKVMLEEKRKS